MTTNSTTFLTKEELAELTGRKMKSRQVEWLRRSGIPFYVNAGGRAVVARAVIEGRNEDVTLTTKPWEPEVLRR